MKDILLTAKYKAYSENKEIIDVEDFQYVINNYTLEHNVLFDDICKKFEISPNQVSDRSLKQLEIDKAKSLEKYKFSSDLKNIINQLKIEGHSTKTSSYYVEEDIDGAVDELWDTIMGRDSETKNTDKKEEKQMTKKEYIQQAINISTNLSKKVLGQDRAVEAISDWSIKQAYHDSLNGPKGIFLFLGPPATGKTYIGELLGDYLEGYSVIKFDMANFTWHGTVSALIGNAPGTNESGAGDLTKHVYHHAKTIIIFDEIEKADMAVQRVLLDLLGNGTLTDLCGSFNDNEPCTGNKQVDFTQTVVVFTSNLGQEIYNNQDFLDNFDSSPLQSESMILEAISRETKKEGNDDIPLVDPALLSRLSKGTTILFNKLKYEHLIKIATGDFEESVKKFTDVFDIKIDYNRKKQLLIELLVLSFAPNVDIRKLKSKIAQNFWFLLKKCG